MSATAAETRIAGLEAALVAAGAALAQGQRSSRPSEPPSPPPKIGWRRSRRRRDLLRASHERLRLELELLRKRIFVAKAERVDTAQLEMEFAAKLAALDRSVAGRRRRSPRPSRRSASRRAATCAT